MRQIVVVENPKRFDLELPGVEVVAARAYLADDEFSSLKRAAVYNLCRSFRYQTLGYYVSLLATARGHRVLPSVATLQDLRNATLLRLAGEDVDRLAQTALKRLGGDEFTLSLYFGRNMAKRYDRLGQALFEHFPAPFLRAEFHREKDRWELDSLGPLAPKDIPASHHEFVAERAAKWFARPGRTRPDAERLPYDLAILWNEAEEEPPSDEGAIRRFERAARECGLEPTVVGPDDYPRIPQFDALFLRETTYVNHHTWRFSRRAAAEGMVVIDDPESIVRATNKVYLAEAFQRAGVPIPRTLVLTDTKQAPQVVEAVGLPCVVKEPDSAFSRGVKKARDEDELRALLDAAFERSELVVVQEWTPSEFDWRIGVLEGKPLYACRYHMSKGHWQIVQTLDSGKRRSGDSDAVPLEQVPPAVLDAAVRAAATIGDGLYGADVKQLEDGRVVVIEVNDNPSLDAGVEDELLGDELYLAIMRSIRRRLDERRH